MKRIAFVCGGTAGHINPALAVAETLGLTESDASILFLGRADSMEERMIARTAYPYKSIPASPLYFRPRALYRLLRDLAAGARTAYRILQDFDADVVVATGGFVCAPVLLAAKRLGIPGLIHEANAFAGRTNRLLGAAAATVCISYEETRAAFPRVGRVVLTGNPVRPAFLTVDAMKARAELRAVDPRRVVLISGGSQGARSLCEAGVEMARLLRERPEAKTLRFILSTGRKQYEEFRPKTRGLEDVLILKDFIYDMHEKMAGAELLISRAGAVSSSEIAVLGKPSILVPYPYAAEDHQTKNAEAFVRAGAAKLIPDGELSGRKLLDAVLEILADPAKPEAMGEAARALAQPEAAALIADEVLRLAGGVREGQ